MGLSTYCWKYPSRPPPPGARPNQVPVATSCLFPPECRHGDSAVLTRTLAHRQGVSVKAKRENPWSRRVYEDWRPRPFQITKSMKIVPTLVKTASNEFPALALTLQVTL